MAANSTLGGGMLAANETKDSETTEKTGGTTVSDVGGKGKWTPASGGKKSSVVQEVFLPEDEL